MSRGKHHASTANPAASPSRVRPSGFRTAGFISSSLLPMPLCRLLCLLPTALLIGACNRAPDPAAELQDVSLDAAVAAAVVKEEEIEETAVVQVDDTNLMRQWARNCALCHVRGEGGAPVIGDIDNWRVRVAQGESTLLKHTVEGLNNMPPLGYCMDCEADDFIALIRFMAGDALTGVDDSAEASET